MPFKFISLRLIAMALAALAFATVGVRMDAQGRGGQATRNAPEVNQSTDPLLQSFRFRSIGPASMGGRIDDIAVSESDPNVIYIGYAVGGVFKSDNNGTSFTPLFQSEPVASIGDIAIHPRDPNIVYVGTGEANNRQTSSFGDGIYKTTDGGKTWTNIGLKETQTIARIVIDPKNPETVYVASPGHLFGPNKERGVFKTTDGGKTWTNVKFIDEDTGFTDIVLDPANSSIIYASSYQRRRSGCCFNGGGPGSGIWKSTDAGKTWTKLTGSGLPPGTYGRIALDVSRSKPNVVYAQIEAGRTGVAEPAPPVEQGAATEPTPAGAAAVMPAGAAGAQQGAAGAAQGAQGQGQGQGRGGRRGGNAPAQPGAAGQQAVAQPGGAGAGGGRGGGYDWCNNAGPAHGFGGRGGGFGGAPEQPAANENRTPPSLDPARGGVFRSDDKGKTWTLLSNCNSRPMYFSQLRVDPENDQTIYVAGLPVAKSLDGGKTFATLDAAGGYGEPGHVDQHAIWIDPKNSKHIMEGNDGGLDVSYDQGKSWDFVNTMATGLAYVVTADMRRPYYVYIGLQDNGSWGGPSSVRGRGGIMNSHWFGIGGGDGFYTAVDPTDYNMVITESQDGNTNRYDLRVGRGQSIRPNAGGGRGRGGRGGATGVAGAAGAEAQAAPPVQVGGVGGFGGRGGAPNVINANPGEVYRFNWNTPVIMSPHNPKIVYLGGNRLFKSYNQGDTWVASNDDLTKKIDRNTVPMMSVPGNVTQLSKNDGVVSYSTIISISESPVMPGIVWAGTDDGNLQVSRDGGLNFTEVGKNLPGLPANNQYWISRIDASHFDQATAYVSVDGHRSDDLKPYVFVTHDFGKTFQSITNNLPQYGNVQVIREDPKNKDLLYVGTEFGLFIALDGGKAWQKFMNNYPTVRTDDILVHPRDNDLIIASHGRSVWIADDITPLQQFTQMVRDSDATLFDIRPAIAWLNDQQNNQQVGGQKVFVGENAPRGAAINYYVKSGDGEAKITVADVNGRTIATLSGPATPGIHRVLWNLAPTPPPDQQQAGRGGFGGGGRGGVAAAEPGSYVVTLEVAGKKLTKSLEVLPDRWLNER
jgi:photosystem II stability/assembly factor-like uncharacterized protein